MDRRRAHTTRKWFLTTLTMQDLARPHYASVSPLWDDLISLSSLARVDCTRTIKIPAILLRDPEVCRITVTNDRAAEGPRIIGRAAKGRIATSSMIGHMRNALSWLKDLLRIRLAETILIVEADARARGVIVAALKGAGYAVLAVPTMSDAEQLLTKDTPIDLLFVDVPSSQDATAVALAQRAKALRPNLKPLYTNDLAARITAGEGQPPKQEEIGRVVRMVRELLRKS